VIALDTNVVVRLLVRDDEAQTARAATLVRDNDVLVTTSVLLETERVSRSKYRAPRAAILTGLRRLTALDRLTVDQPSTAARALDWYEAGLDLADALHVASSGAATGFATFDREFARRAADLGTRPPVLSV
jgi:predicted nucleic acid-binding protein